MNEHLPEIGALLLLIVASAFFSGSEAALISVSRIHARAMVERGVKGAEAVVALLEDRNPLLTTILGGNTVVMAVLLLLFGEIIPKTVAVAGNERWAVRLAPVLGRVVWLLTPIDAAFL